MSGAKPLLTILLHSVDKDSFTFSSSYETGDENGTLFCTVEAQCNYMHHPHYKDYYRLKQRIDAFIIILATYSDYFPTDFEPVVFQNLDGLFHCAAGTQYLQVLFICTEAVKLLNRNFKNEDWKLSIVSKCRHEYYLSRKI